MNIPNWADGIPATRFSTCSDRAHGRATVLSDYIAAVASNNSLPATKENAPAWALCNDTGTNEGRPNGLVQLDFDHVRDVDWLKAKLAEYGGFLFAARTFSGGGVVALAYVGAISSDPRHVDRLVYKPVLQYLAECGLADGDAFKLDPACAKPCQLRFESRDTHPFIASEFTPMFVDGNIAAHPLALLAEAFRPGEGDSPAGYASAVAAVASAVDVSSAMYEGAKAYPARAFVVLIGEPGTRKTSTLDAVQDAAVSIGVTVTDPKNAPTLRDHIKLCGTDQITVTETTEGGKTRQVTQTIERKDAPADPLLVVIDEAGQILRSRVIDETCGSMGAMLRKCNADRITIESIKGQEKAKGSYRVPANVCAFLATTPEQWCEYVASVSQENGEARRMIELWQPGRPGDMFSSFCNEPDMDTACECMRSLHEMSELWRTQNRVFIPEYSARGAFRSARELLISRGIDAPSADSLIMCYSTLFAAFRAAQDGKTTITYADLNAAIGLLSMVMDARDRLKAMAEKANEGRAKPESEVWAELRGWIEKAPRRDKLREKISRRPPAYARVFEQMVTSGAVIFEKDSASGKYICRFATADELEKSSEKTVEVKAEIHDEIVKAKDYAACSEDDKESRLIAYYAQFRKDHDLVEGGRNIALNKLAWSLQRAGMWDDTGKAFFSIVASKSGLGDAEIRTLMRERKTK